MRSNAIDFVIAWVDDTDEKWLSEKAKYSNSDGDSRSIRYRDWGFLKYWFRSIEKYTPWVNKVYLVTAGQKPDWINVDCEKLVIVDHKDFIPKEYLPTFNSHAIELNLHRISGLSEQFVYFNDDMFVTSRMKPSDFFKNGLPCDSAILSPAIQDAKDAIGTVELNNMSVINTYFNKNAQISSNKLKWYSPKYQLSQSIKNILLKPWNSFTSFYEFHVANPFLKKTFEEVWKKEYDLLDDVCKRKFRDLKRDCNQWLMRDWQLASNAFVPKKTNTMNLFTISDTNTANICAKAIIRKKYQLICINDSKDLADFKTAKKIILDSFEKNLPDKSVFEKGNF